MYVYKMKKNSLFLTSFFYFQRPHKAKAEEMTRFHSDEYVKFIQNVRPDNIMEFNKQMQRCRFY